MQFNSSVLKKKHTLRDQTTNKIKKSSRKLAVKAQKNILNPYWRQQKCKAPKIFTKNHLKIGA
jgi:hypothetical protein